MTKEARTRPPLETFRRTLLTPDVPITLFSLRGALDAALIGRDGIDQRTLRGMVDIIGSPAVLPQVLGSIQRDPETFASVQERSYGHEAGFDRLELAGGDEYDLRVHTWWPEGEFTEQPHDHRWKSASRVVKGGLENNLFVVSAKGIEVQEFMCAPADTSGASRVNPSNSVRLEQVGGGDIFIAEDESYSLSERAIHQACSKRDEPTLTVHLRGKALRQSSRFFSGEPDDTQVLQVREIDLGDSLQRISRTLYR